MTIHSVTSTKENHLPQAWSELTWQQLCDLWTVKMRYGGNADVSRAAALLVLLGLDVPSQAPTTDAATGEAVYKVFGRDGSIYHITPRELSQLALGALRWFDFPYGDPGEPAVKDDKGKVIKEARAAVRGYVGKLDDALSLPIETIKVGCRHFALPQVACNNITWQQYRELQALAPQLFAEGTSEEDALELQARFLAHALVPRSLALLETTGGTIRIRPHFGYSYNPLRGEAMVVFWKKRLKEQSSQNATLFHIVFQTYQTALSYYAAAYPLLFNDDGRKTKVHDALSGEVSTINTVMKYAGYSEQQQVYDSNLPFVLDILNTMAKEAKEIEKMNAKIKKK